MLPGLNLNTLPATVVNGATVGTFICSFCGTPYSNFARCSNHVRTHIPTAVCPECYEQFPSVTAMLTHRQSHEVKEGNVIICTTCYKWFPNKRTHARHVQTCKKHFEPDTPEVAVTPADGDEEISHDLAVDE